jgi:membrane protein YdbS with pleckstrin-like domain
MPPVSPLPAIFALLVGAIGWYYLFYSQAARKLDGIEDQKTNRVRGILRRINAIIMLLLALGIAVGWYEYDWDRQPRQVALIWLGIMVLLLIFVVLALIDVRLTWKLRRTLRERKRP